MNEVELDPTPAVRRYIERAVGQNLQESPVRYPFQDGWPVQLSELEAEEVLYAVQRPEPDIGNPHGKEHRKMAMKEVGSKIR